MDPRRTAIFLPRVAEADRPLSEEDEAEQESSRRHHQPTSFTGAVWKQMEHLADSAPEAEDGFEQILQTLDRIYQYDSKVEMPKAFERFFYQISRTSGQTLMSYCSDYREAERELVKYDVRLPSTVSGWLLLRRAGLIFEQRQLVISQVSKDMKVDAVEEALYFLFGQDFKGRSTLRMPLPSLDRWADVSVNQTRQCWQVFALGGPLCGIHC